MPSGRRIAVEKQFRCTHTRRLRCTLLPKKDTIVRVRPLRPETVVERQEAGAAHQFIRAITELCQ
jgi:hypothetical protein